MVKRQGDDGGRDNGARLTPLLDRIAFEAAQASLGPDDAEQMIGTRRALARAALEVSGVDGYARTTVEAIIERTGSNRHRFYLVFSSKEECWIDAYRAAAHELSCRLLSAGAGGRDWRDGLERALGELADFTEEEPALARSLISEVYVAGPRALAAKREVFGRLSRAIDRARQEAPAQSYSPPPITADFLLGAIETTARRSLLGGRAFRKQLPVLTRLSLLFYFGAAGA